jgi:hypothetical protein
VYESLHGFKEKTENESVALTLGVEGHESGRVIIDTVPFLVREVRRDMAV